MKLIIGLGNPGREYSHNRHNIGFLCINQLAREHSIQVKKNKCQSQVGSGRIGDEEVLLVKPKTYMNRSGDAVSKLLKEYRAKPQDIIVICDDLNLPLGKLRIRENGSAGGHNGLKSIIASIGSEDFPRMRIGIGQPSTEQKSHRDDAVIDHVLGDFMPDEQAAIKMAITRTAEAVECILSEGITSAMNKFN
jgi:peptidyl-tRNA hydrolase, PTH1 family